MTVSPPFYNIYVQYIRTFKPPVAVAARSKAYVYGRSPAAILWGSNPTGAWMFVLNVMCCHVEVSATS
jgi:hypothetical protein